MSSYTDILGAVVVESWRDASVCNQVYRRTEISEIQE